jgi:hypothetical protein
MGSNFPGALDTLATNLVDSTAMASVHPAAHDDANDAINKIEAYLVPALNTQTGTTYTLVAADQSKLVGMNNASPNTLTVPPNSTVAFLVGTQITVRQVGAGQTTFAPGAGVTINSRGAALNLAGQYAYATLVKVATDVWELTGDITA